MKLHKRKRYLSWARRLEYQVDEQGLRQGQAFVYNEENRRVERRHYKDGNPHGLWEGLDRHGEVLWHYHYEHGNLVKEKVL